MKNLLLADVHSNIEALTSVLDHAGNVGYDRILVCGDIVGYNANQKEVIDVLRDEKAICIRGNHDRESVTGIADGFNGAAKKAANWTYHQLKGTPYMEWLEKLPQGPFEIEHDVFLCHGSPRNEDEYMNTARSTCLLSDHQRIVFFGHTHYPSLFGPTEMKPEDGTEIYLRNEQWMINPGSTGQPRDGDPRTCYAIWDSKWNTVKFARIPYDVKTTQRKIREAGLPKWLADRLAGDQ